jgi:uncharacterized protein
MFVPGFPDFAIAGLIFFGAGTVKGVLGMGLPTVAMGLLGLVMPVAQAASLLAVPSLATNVWQAGQGQHLRALLLRLWPLHLGVVLGVAAGSGFMHAGSGRGASLLLGICLVVYGAAGLAGWVLRRPPRVHERWCSAVAGVLTGLLTAATGVFVLPAVPWLQALGLDKDEMSQALGMGFTVSTLALAVSLSAGGSFTVETALHSALLLVPAMAGMALGQRVRGELSQQAFRRLFFAGLLALGLWLVLRQF